LITNWAALPSEDIYFSLKDIGFVLKAGDLVHIRDLWAQKDIGTFTHEQSKADLFIEKVPAHGSKVYRFNLIKSGLY